ncbi:D-3-phosphoglycerate dehydrogenase [Enhygromyxa salina]|uniref:D-3-phosphoglycerate dehydrogenase n=1 Tax=Enhygromyxa salina TaxID=215803 RepID=A0A0C1ZC02_9BACT|nr:D-glycerate dehydrogenase [Enhygromyxa salina]KIG15224.1 D-3-phosphoglycerate dehydrogenase [Enhygromyxa salina]
MTHLVIVPPEVPREWLARLDQAQADCEVIVGIDAVPSPRLPEVVGLLSLLTMPVDLELLVRLPALRVVSNMAVGYDNVVLPACAARGVALGNTPGVLTDATADLTMALLLAAARRLDVAALDAREGRWHAWSPDGWLGVELRGATLGVVGLGKIGFAVAERARGFGMQICYVGRSDQDHPQAKQIGAQRLSLDELLVRADFVSLHVPLTDETQGLINAAALEKMKAEAILINTSRGAIVDQDALLAALTQGRLRGAALDVTSPEPLPPSHPLFAAPGCLILPHIGSATHTTRRRMAELACLNLLAGIRGEPLPHPVTC